MTMAFLPLCGVTGVMGPTHRADAFDGYVDLTLDSFALSRGYDLFTDMVTILGHRQHIILTHSSDEGAFQMAKVHNT